MVARRIIAWCVTVAVAAWVAPVAAESEPTALPPIDSAVMAEEDAPIIPVGSYGSDCCPQWPHYLVFDAR